MRRLAAFCLLLAACRDRPATPAATPPPSVLLVTIDTLRADRLGSYGDAAARTPHLDRLAASSVVFEHAYTVAPVTLPAHASLMTGLLPPAHGVRGNGSFALGPGPRTLAEVLRARGMKTAAFVGGFPLASRFGLARGFDTYDDTMPRAAGVHYEFAERPAPQVTAAARTWLAGQRGPVFVWVHLFDPHAPYAPPPAHAGGDPYRGEIAAVDEALAPLLADWDARGPGVTVVTSDHGEAFGEHGEESHSLFVYDTTLHVPLILRAPGLAPRRVRGPAGLADVAATVLHRAFGSSTLPGRDLLQGGGGALYAETLAPRLDFGWSDLRSWRDGRLKYIRAPRPELYDVEADPGELRNLVDERPQDARRLSASLDAALVQAGERESRRAEDGEAAERLRALGYVQGPGGSGSAADPKDMVGVALRIARATGPFESHAGAARVYAEIAALDPKNPLVQMRLGDALLRDGRPADAVPAFRKVVAAGPQGADPFVGLATALASLGRLREAQEVLHDAEVRGLANGQVFYNLGEIARLGGDARAAAEAYRKAIADPVTRERAQARLESLP